MTYREFPILPGNYYHVFNRGNNHKRIFYEERNYPYFLKKLYKAFKDKVIPLAYCLMPNHYHLLVTPNKKDELEKAMQKIGTGYARAVNNAYDMDGHLFTGPYKAKLVPDNNSILRLSRYIHLNPVKAKLVKKPEDWTHSSYPDYIGLRKNVFLDTSLVLDQFKDLQAYKKYVELYSQEDENFLKSFLFEDDSKN